MAKKAKKKSKSVTKKKTAKRAPVKKAARKAVKKKPAAKKPARKKSIAVTVRKAIRKATKAVTKALSPTKKKKKRTVGEGDYQASRTFLKDQAGFVKKNKAKIPALARQAEADLDGPQGNELRAAEAEARGHSKAGSEQ